MRKNSINEILDLMGRMELLSEGAPTVDSYENNDETNDDAPQQTEHEPKSASSEIGTPIIKLDNGPKKETSHISRDNSQILLKQGDGVYFFDVIKGINNSFRGGPDNITPKEFLRLFRSFIKGKKILFPPSEERCVYVLTDECEGHGLVTIPSGHEIDSKSGEKIEKTVSLDELSLAYYNGIQNNEYGRFGMVLELLFGKKPDSDSSSDIGRETGDGTELKTKNDKAKSGVIAITQTGIHSLEELSANNKILPNGLAAMINNVNIHLNEIIKQTMKNLNIGSPLRLSYEVDFAKIDNLSSNINNGQLCLFPDMVDDTFKDLLSFYIKFNNGEKSVPVTKILLQGKNELTYTISTPIIKSTMRVVTIYQYNDRTLFNSNSTKDFEGKINLDFVLNKIHNKCPNLFVSTGTKGKMVYELDNNKDVTWNDDTYEYNEGYLYRWNEKTATTALLIELIRNKFIGLKFEPKISKPQEKDNTIENNINGYRIRLTAHMSFNFRKLIDTPNNLLTKLFTLQEKA